MQSSGSRPGEELASIGTCSEQAGGHFQQLFSFEAIQHSSQLLVAGQAAAPEGPLSEALTFESKLLTLC